MSVNLEPWHRETPNCPEERSSAVASFAIDGERQWLLFGGQEGRVRYLDLVTGETGILLEPPGRPWIAQIALSRDHSALGITCAADFYDESPNQRGAAIQFWNYQTSCKRSSTSAPASPVGPAGRGEGGCVSPRGERTRQ
jgi:hypothetical protein